MYPRYVDIRFVDLKFLASGMTNAEILEEYPDLKIDYMPPVSHPFKQGALIILMNYNDHAPPHVHVKYQRDVRSYRITIQTREWMQPGRELSLTLRRLVEIWVEAHEQELLAQWEKARNGEQVMIVG